MKWLASGLIGLLLLTSCGPNDNDNNGPAINESKSPIPSVTTQVTPEPTYSTTNVPTQHSFLPTDTDGIYLMVVKKHIDDSNLDDEQILRLGDSACSSARDGDNFVKTVDRISLAGLTDSDAAYLVGAAFAAYCPEQLDNIPGA